MKKFAFAAALFVAFLIPAPAQAHSWQELNEWLDKWYQRLAYAMPYATGRIPTTIAYDPLVTLNGVLAEYDDMIERHPGWDGSYLTGPVPGLHDPKPKPQPRSASLPKNRGMGNNVEQWRGLVSAYFSADKVETALCVMKYESGGNPTAYNSKYGASGLFQHLKGYWKERSSAAGWGGADIFSPEANVAVAAWLQATQGWGHWSTYRHCR